MEQFRIYCTEEQTKRALELGAPITLFTDSGYVPEDTAEKWHMCILGSKSYIIPTTEEMIGWIEEQGLYFLTGMDDEDKFFFNVYHNEGYIEARSCDSRKEATLTAIDVALNYLENKNKKG